MLVSYLWTNCFLDSRIKLIDIFYFITLQQIVTEMLGKFNKKLDEAQMASLLSKESSQNPLWLSVACEELRVFGLFAKVTDKINSLADGLLEWVSMATPSSYLNIDLGAVSRSFFIAFPLLKRVNST